MRFVVILIITMLSHFTVSANSYQVNIVGWSDTNAQFDTTVTVISSDTLVFLNRAGSIASFFKYVNGVRVDTIYGVAINDTIDVHALQFSDTVVTYYIWTQVLAYGLRCHIQFINLSIDTAPKVEALLTITGTSLVVTSPTKAKLSVLDMNGRLIAEYLTSAETTEVISLDWLKPGSYLAVLENESGVAATKKIVRSN